MKKNHLQSKNLSIAETFTLFERHNQMKNLSPATIQYYEHWTKPFFDFYGDTAESIAGITEDDVEEYILHLHQKESISDVSINTSLRAVRAFLYFAMKKGYLASFKISMIKTTERVKEPYTDSELASLLEKPDVTTCTFAYYRNWVIVNFLLATGCRASSLIHVRIEDLDLKEGTVLFRHIKTRSQQVMPLSSTICSILTEYLFYRDGVGEETLFVSETGKDFSVSALECCIRNYNRSRGVEKTSLHLFRHTYAKCYIVAGGDPFRLQRLLGHSDLSMTKKYVALYADDLKDNYDKLNPLEQHTRNKKQTRMSLKK